ncbi:diguanylate cyclase (GGDEF) domain-containing protein [Arboricoccus pini]|uniref:Diguanylate cyclase (GGDEF) domain-containing protein n=1 Tax=Arboricoccus pini TaxID=1963835 RepID=A0A212R0C4_9PROT|nr:diguanylate cyclase (GGDEF) domain-containing protein [Arboricoccus pini]
MHFFAFYDVLTGLPNRRLFLEKLLQSLEHARVINGMVAVLLLDLDRFRLINESLGFATGDQVLSAVAGRLVAQLGEQETTARLSSDEFIILVPNVGSVEAAGKMARHLLETIRSGLVLADHELSL